MSPLAAVLPRSDPRRAHGAWVDLVVAVGAGALCADGALLVPALLAGTGHAGAFLVLGAAFGRRDEARVLRAPAPSRRVLGAGALLVALAPLLALALGARPAFLAWGAASVPLGLAARSAAHRLGRLSPAALLLGTAAIAMAAPTAATAGGARLGRALALVLLLASFFGWRALSLGRRIGHGESLRGVALRAAGLREARLAACFALAVAAVLRAV